MDEASRTFLTFLQEGKVNEAGEFLAAHLGLDPEDVCGELELTIIKWKTQLQKAEPLIKSALSRDDYEGAAALFVIATDYKLNHAHVVELLKKEEKKNAQQ